MNGGQTLDRQELPPAAARQRHRVLLRLVLGLLQIFGASAGLYLVVRTGLSVPTVAAVTGTLAISIASRIIFTKQ